MKISKHGSLYTQVNPDRSNQDINHRRDLDGLRALAALSVVASHTTAFPGGDTGVDMFFVLSGYLISGIILRGLARQNFSFSEFYGRRIRRIFPALIVVLTTVWLLGSLVLLPDDFQHLGKQIATSSTFSLYIFKGLEGYAPDNVDLGGNYLDQLWSLGVEEQFYLLWPLCLLIVWKLGKKDPSVIGIAIAAITIATFVLSMATGSLPTGMSLIPWRSAFELSAGALLACGQTFSFSLLGKISERIKSSHFSFLLRPYFLGFAAAAILLVAILTDPDKQIFPDSRAFAPTGGTLLLIAAGTQSPINRMIFGSSPMVFVGLISYPLYLWHFPIIFIILGLAWGHTPNQATMFFLVVTTSVVLAFFTCKYVELPIRFHPKKATAIWALCIAMLFCAALGFSSSLGTIRPVSYLIAGDLASSAAEHLSPDSNSSSWIRPPDRWLTIGKGSRHILFVGDSSMQQYYPRIETLLSDSTFQKHDAVFATRPGCAPGVVEMPTESEAKQNACRNFIRNIVNYAQDPKVESVVIAASWYAYFFGPWNVIAGPLKEESLKTGSDAAFESLRKTVTEFRQSGKSVYLVLNIPIGGDLDPRAYWPALLPNPDAMPNYGKNKVRVMTALKPIESKLRKVAEETGAIVIDPLQSLCDETSCPPFDAAGKSMYRDLWHLRPSYVRQNVKFLDAILMRN